jgi:hypothetical protein
MCVCVCVHSRLLINAATSGLNCKCSAMEGQKASSGFELVKRSERPTDRLKYRQRRTERSSIDTQKASPNESRKNGDWASKRMRRRRWKWRVLFDGLCKELWPKRQSKGRRRPKRASSSSNGSSRQSKKEEARNKKKERKKKKVKQKLLTFPTRVKVKRIRSVQVFVDSTVFDYFCSLHPCRDGGAIWCFLACSWHVNELPFCSRFLAQIL